MSTFTAKLRHAIADAAHGQRRAFELRTGIRPTRSRPTHTR